MKALDVAVQSIATRIVDSLERQRYIGLLESMAEDCTLAMDLWQQVLTKATIPSNEVAVLMNWTGPVIAKKLFGIHVEFRAKMLVITDGRGNLEDPVIPSAYYLLKTGETGTSYAQQAIELARQTKLTLKAHVKTIRTTVPKKVAAPLAAVKKGSKKAVTKKVKVIAKPLAKKPLSKKKAAVKKPTVKKAVAKPAAKKKTVAKKPVLKKAVKKKTKKK